MKFRFIPSAAIFHGNNCFRSKWFIFNFTFVLYLGVSWIEAVAAQETIEILTGWWKDVFWIFGKLNVMRSCASCEWKYLQNICTMNGATDNFFWSLLKGRVRLASTQNFILVRYTIHACFPSAPHFYIFVSALIWSRLKEGGRHWFCRHYKGRLTICSPNTT